MPAIAPDKAKTTMRCQAEVHSQTGRRRLAAPHGGQVAPDGPLAYLQHDDHGENKHDHGPE